MKQQKVYKIIGDKASMSNDDWLALRKNSIGGSEIAAAIGLSRWSSPFKLWAEKTEQIKREDKPNQFMYWGNVLEEVIRREFEKQYGYKVITTSAIFASAKHPYLTANLDGYADLGNGSFAVLECKTCNVYAESDWAEGGCPLEYYLQCQHYLCVTGLQTAFLAVLIGGNDFRSVKIERDETTINLIIRRGAEFMDMVATMTAPIVTDKDNEVLAQLYPLANKEKPAVKLPSSFNSILEDYFNAKVMLDEAKRDKEAAEAKIKEFLKDADSAVLGDYKVSWKNVNRSSFSSEKAKALLTEEQIADCTVSSTSRTLRITKSKPKAEK